MNNNSLAVLILAAGKGTRMNSNVPKVLHSILNRPIINYVLDSVSSFDPEKIVIVLGYESNLIKEKIDGSDFDVAIQDKQLGTGHAVLSARGCLGNFEGSVLILSGDTPLINPKTLNSFFEYHASSCSKVSFITSDVENPFGYGRIIKDKDGQIIGIVEEKDANEDQKEIKEINSGIYIVDSLFLWESLKKLNNDNKQNEYYLPEIIEYAVNNDYKVSTYKIENYEESLGINTRAQLLELGSFMKNKINSTHIDKGVTIIDPATTYISPEVKIGMDTIINPNTYIYGKTNIGESCMIGPSVYIEDSDLGDKVEVKFSSYLTNCKIENGVTLGPFCHLRPEAHIAENAKIGNFVEIKKSKIGVGSKVPHLSYVGDATVGDNVNIGAGTITCNYDGVDKHQTIIEDNVFIGSDTMLVAPVRIGKEATTAAGSTITKDVGDGSLAIERSTQKEISGWSERRKKKKESK